MDNLFSPELKELISKARMTAIDLGYDYISTVHFFIADCESEKPNSILRFGFSDEKEFKKFKSDYTIEKGDHLNLIDKSLPLTSEAEKTIRLTESERIICKQTDARPCHLFIAALKNRESLLFEYFKHNENALEGLTRFYEELGEFEKNKINTEQISKDFYIPSDNNNRFSMTSIEKKYQVFVSSTYQDLIEERDEVMKALLELDCIPTGMELFPSTDDEAFSYIKKVIDNCDYFIVIIGGRYGTQHQFGKSYTQLEYEYACSKAIPTLAFINKDPEMLTANKYELDPEKREKLNEFKKTIQKKLCRYWNTKGELSALVSRSVVKLMKDKPQLGWIRSSNTQETGFQARVLNKLQELEHKNEIFVKKQNSTSKTTIKIENLNYEKIELEIIALSQSTTNSTSYAVVLGTTNSKRRLPIVIGGFEAQSLAVALEKMQPERPLTHKLLYDTILRMDYFVKEIVIYNLIDGIFISKIVLTDEYNYIELDSRTADALNIAVLSNAPIYCSKNVFENAAIDDNDSSDEPIATNSDSNSNNFWTTLKKWFGN